MSRLPDETVVPFINETETELIELFFRLAMSRYFQVEDFYKTLQRAVDDSGADIVDLQSRMMQLARDEMWFVVEPGLEESCSIEQTWDVLRYEMNDVLVCTGCYEVADSVEAHFAHIIPSMAAFRRTWERQRRELQVMLDICDEHLNLEGSDDTTAVAHDDAIAARSQVMGCLKASADFVFSELNATETPTYT